MVYASGHIWKLFSVIMATGLLMLAAVTYNLWNQLNIRYTLEQENITTIVSNSTESMLRQYEVTLNVLGEYLLRDEAYKDIKKSKIILKRLIKQNPSIAGFGLVNPNGKLYVTSIDKSVDKLPNLLKKEDAKNSFKEALHSDKMVLGRTYFHKTLNTYIIPIRKAIKDKKGNVLAVMTAGIKVKEWYSLIDIKKDNFQRYSSYIFRDADHFLQLVPNSSTHKKVQYSSSLPIEYMSRLEENIIKTANSSIDEIKNGTTVITMKYNRFLDGAEVLGSFDYVPKYNIWTIIQIEYSILLDEFYGKLIPIVIFFVLIGITIFFLFWQLSTMVVRNRKKLVYQAEHDYVTNLENRYYLSKKFDYKKLSRKFSLVAINIDNFKNINDTFGYINGDAILKEIGVRLKKLQKNSDVLVRYGSDEFLFVIYDITHEEVIKFAQKVLETVQKSYFIGDSSLILGCSIGIANYQLGKESFDDIKKFANIALIEAKKRKNCYSFFENDIKEKYFRTSLIEHELKEAIKHDEVHMVYQPQVMSNEKLYGVEALVRWENRKLGFVPPDEFITIAEKTGVIIPLGQYILQRSLSEIAKIQKQTKQNFQLSINISVKQFLEPTFFEDLMILIKDTGYDKSLLTLEVTENLFIENIEFVLKVLKKLRKEGIKISLDDFGTGYSSLSLLKKLPIDELKIDKSFVDDIETEENAIKMIRGIILIGKQLKMELLAEGVEKVEQRDILYAYGCDLFQGYYFSRPLKKEVLLDFLEI